MLESKSKIINYSIFCSMLWLLFFSLGAQIIAITIVTIVQRLSGVEQVAIEVYLKSPVGLGVVSLISAAIVLSMLKRATKSFAQVDVWSFLGFKTIDKQSLLKILFYGAVYYGSMSLILYLANIPTPQFMLDIKDQTSTFLSILMLLTAVLIVAPMMEEIIFRGVGYGRLKFSKVGIFGSIILPSFLFTIVHLQYELVDLLGVLILGLILGYIRYKTNNTWYCVVFHFQVNFFATISIFTIG